MIFIPIMPYNLAVNSLHNTVLGSALSFYKRGKLLYIFFQIVDLLQLVTSLNEANMCRYGAEHIIIQMHILFNLRYSSLWVIGTDLFIYLLQKFYY